MSDHRMSLLDKIRRHAEIPDQYAWAELGITVPEARSLFAHVERLAQEVVRAEERGYAKAVGDYRAGGGDAERAEARAEGYALAVERLRDDERYRHWWTARGYAPEERYWEAEPRGHLADYLVTVERTQDGGVVRA